MSYPRLSDSLQKLGLTESEINDTFPGLLESQDKGEVDSSDNAEVPTGYLSDESDDNPDHDDLEEYIDSLDDDTLEEMIEELAEALGLEEGFIRLKSASKRRAARKKMKKWLKTGAGRAYARKKTRVAKTAMYKKKQKKHEKKLAARGGSRMNKIFREAEADESKSEAKNMLESIIQLEESLEHDPVEDFELFAKSFNGIADIGELTAASVLESNEEQANLLATIAVGAENVLRYMEGLGGEVRSDERHILEATLADAIDYVGQLLAKENLLEGVGKDAISRMEDIVTKEDLDESLSIWDAPGSVTESVLQGIRKLQSQGQ
jgi:hypothetical protein